MKKITLLFVTLSLFACNDGNFDVPAFEFSDTINSCGNYILYKTNSNKTEVLVLTINESNFKQEAGETTISIGGATKVSYRIFNEGINSDYFCQDIPPFAPTVLKELIADEGSVIITASEIVSDNVISGYSYDINLTDLLLTNNDEKIYFENYFFGTFEVNL